MSLTFRRKSLRYRSVMPFFRKTARLPSRHFISFDEVERSNLQVTREMENLGFWHSKLDPVTVWHVPVALGSYGWFKEREDIYIPAITGAHLSDLFLGYHTRLVDVLRHEWAHALADRRPSLVKCRDFRDAFGGSYQLADPVGDYDRSDHLTPYAATSPCEDFAETFHCFLRHKGRLPKRLQNKPTIIRKWRFVESLRGR